MAARLRWTTPRVWRRAITRQGRRVRVRLPVLGSAGRRGSFAVSGSGTGRHIGINRSAEPLTRAGSLGFHQSGNRQTDGDRHLGHRTGRGAVHPSRASPLAQAMCGALSRAEPFKRHQPSLHGVGAICAPRYGDAESSGSGSRRTVQTSSPLTGRRDTGGTTKHRPTESCRKPPTGASCRLNSIDFME